MRGLKEPERRSRSERRFLTHLEVRRDSMIIDTVSAYFRFDET